MDLTGSGDWLELGLGVEGILDNEWARVRLMVERPANGTRYIVAAKKDSFVKVDIQITPIGALVPLHDSHCSFSGK